MVLWIAYYRGYLHRIIIVLGVLTKLFLNGGVSLLSGIAHCRDNLDHVHWTTGLT